CLPLSCESCPAHDAAAGQNALFRGDEVKVLAALPAASTGKILKHRLRELV
ncbi:MAG: Long-chain-fatty-acid--CoA ligase (EC, partial [uncultured Paraburkholderia sp.]